MRTIETLKLNLAVPLNEIQFILKIKHAGKPEHSGIY